MKKTFNFLLVMLISLMVLVSGCGKPKGMTFATYKSNWNSIVKENIENNKIDLPESAIKLPDAKPNKDNTGTLVYNIPLVNITQTKNFLVAEVDESDQIRSITLHATLSRMSVADRRDDLYQALQLASLAIFSMKAPDGEKARKLLLGLSESGSVKEHYLMGRNRTYTDENGNEYLFNSVANDMFTLIIKTKLESENAKKNAVPPVKITEATTSSTNKPNATTNNQTPLDNGYVNGSDVNLRKAPSKNADVIKTLDHTNVSVLEFVTDASGQEWVKVSLLNDGTEGYIAKQYFKHSEAGYRKDSEQSIGRGHIVGTNVIMRNGASREADPIGEFKNNESLEILKYENMPGGEQWVKIRRSNGKKGFVFAKYLQKD